MKILMALSAAVISVVIMFLLVKLIGKRSISQMNMFDYVNSITIGSIGAELATSDFRDMYKYITAMAVYAFFVILISYLSRKTAFFRRFIEGRCVVLVKNGKLLDLNFKKAKMNLNEFLMECRLNGYFSLGDIKSAVQESNGRISFLPKNSQRPATVEDLALDLPEESIYYNVIIDGKVLLHNLKNAGYNREWLEKKLKDRNVKQNEVFFSAVSSDGDFLLFLRQSESDNADLFDI